MSEPTDLEQLLAAASIEPDVFALRPDYRVMLIAAAGLVNGPGDEASERMLAAAEESVAARGDQPVQDIPHVESWRDAYRSFGAKPQRTRNSLEALLRRASSGLPRVNRLTDAYNAISVQYLIPLGGEDLDRYAGPPHLVRATGTEPFDTSANGEDVVERPEPGEVVWRDDVGVTCRRWNWRQCRRTHLSDETTSALFILDALDPMSDEAIERVADALVSEVVQLGTNVTVARRLLTRP